MVSGWIHEGVELKHVTHIWYHGKRLWSKPVGIDPWEVMAIRESTEHSEIISYYLNGDCIYVYIYIYIIHAYIYIYIHTCIYTHLHLILTYPYFCIAV